MTLFQALQSQLAPGSASLKPLCPTRWTIRIGAIQSVLCNYSILCEALEQINAETRDEYGQKAGGYLAQMEKFSTFFWSTGRKRWRKGLVSAICTCA